MAIPAQVCSSPMANTPRRNAGENEISTSARNWKKAPKTSPKPVNSGQSGITSSPMALLVRMRCMYVTKYPVPKSVRNPTEINPAIQANFAKQAATSIKTYRPVPTPSRIHPSPRTGYRKALRIWKKKDRFSGETNLTWTGAHSTPHERQVLTPTPPATREFTHNSQNSRLHLGHKKRPGDLG